MKILKGIGRIERDGHLRLDLPTKLPAGNIELVMIVNVPAEKTRKGKYDFSDLSGKLSWKGDGLAHQKELRNEWA
jgi:hypothetical protein